MKKYQEVKFVITFIENADVVTSSTGAFDNFNDNIFYWNA